MAKKKGKAFEIEYHVEAMISISVTAETEEEARQKIEDSDVYPKFGEYTTITDCNTKYIGVSNMTDGWDKFNQ